MGDHQVAPRRRCAIGFHRNALASRLQPGPGYQPEGQNAGNPLPAFAEAADVEAGGQQTAEGAGGEAQKVPQNVGAFAADAGVGQQRDGGEQGREIAPPIAAAQKAAPPDEGAGQPQSGEGGRGSAQGSEGGRLQPRIGQVAQEAAQQHQKPAEASAEKAAHEQAEQGAEEGIAGQMAQIGMQGEGGDRPPPLAVAHQLGVHQADLPPVPAEGGSAFQIGQQPDQQQIGQHPDPAGIEDVQARTDLDRLPVFLFVAGQFRLGPGGLAGRHQQTPFALLHFQAMGNASGGQHQNGFLQPPPISGAAQFHPFAILPFEHGGAGSGPSAERARRRRGKRPRKRPWPPLPGPCAPSRWSG